MQSVKILIAALMLAGCAQTQTTSVAQSDAAASENWTSVLDAPCRRCVVASLGRDHAPVPIPKRAIVYSFTGEFASRSYWWLIDLDTGEITEHESVSKKEGGWTETTNHLGRADAAALENLRASASRLWRSESYDALRWLPPGSFEDDYVISGSRLVAFSRFAPNDRYIVTAINSTLPAGAPISSGSFVVMPPRKTSP